MPFTSTAHRFTAPSLRLWLGCFAYACFVVYGSLVPLDFHARPLGAAWQAFQRLPMLQIGLEGRADWIANGVLFVPLAFLTATLLGAGRGRLPRALALPGAIILCCAFAVAIEFLQLFFPPRTVSMNDVVAEWLGAVLGAVIAARWGGSFLGFVDKLTGDPARNWRRLLTAYAVAYLALALFPYDLLLSLAEFGKKLDSGNFGWLLANASLRGGLLMGLAKLSAEVLAALPFGLLLGYRSAKSTPPRLAPAFAAGLALGLFIEMAQFFIFSGVSQGLSLLTRALGVCAGAALWRAGWNATSLAVPARRFAPLLGVSYLLALMSVHGWFSRTWGGAEMAARKLAEVHFVPFYYHYFTSEAAALVSLTSVCLMYAPIGVFAWAARVAPLPAAWIAACVAFVVEAAKLFHQRVHPDPTDLLIAAGAAWAVAQVMYRLIGGSATRAPSPGAAEIRRMAESHPQPWREAGERPATIPDGRPRAADAGSPSSRHGVSRRPYLGCAGALAALLVVAWGVASFPFHPALLGLLLAAIAALIWRHPVLLVAVIPAALPVFDLAPWSGHFYIDEFDFLILAALAVGYLRVPPAPRVFARDRLFAIIAGLVGISYAIGCVRGLLPWQAPDANSFTNYYSPYNALRIAKGALWAFFLYGLLRRLAAAGQDIRRVFAWGMVIGLAATVAVIVWERLTFSGLFNFANDYRVTGPFSQLHTGGAYIEGFLTAAAPFLLLLLFSVRSALARTAGVALLLGTTYALMVTFSRNGYVAFAVALGLFFATAIGDLARQRASVGVRRAAAIATLTALTLAVALPVFRGEFSQARLSQVANDLRVRENHWSDALRIRDTDLTTAVLGMGLGRYPETHYWRSAESNRSAAYRIETEGSNAFLRIGSGNAVYLEQFVAVEPRRNYLLSLDVRSHQPGSRITVPVCEKWLLTSYNCAWQSFDLGNETGKWQHYEKRIASDKMADGHWFARRPVRLTLYNSSGRAAVDVDNVRLASEDGADLLNNGDFGRGLDRWFFSTDSHLPWHIKNLPLSVLFDQGWFGVLAFGLLAVLAVWRAARDAWQGSLGAGAVLAASTGFLLVGAFDSLVDTPRFLLLFLLLAWFACGRTAPQDQTAASGQPRSGP